MKITKRLYNDFFRPSKEGDYEKIIKAAKDNGYEIHTVLSFETVVNEGIDPSKRYLILRRDVDTADFKILREMLTIEIKYGARASYYFRWNTMNAALMREIENAGGEASYHYEEVATYCFKHRIKKYESMVKHIEDIRDLFISQYRRFKLISGLDCVTVASHGEFVNKIVGAPSWILMDERVRKECGIIREAYDKQRMDLLTCRLADQVEMEQFTEKAIAAIQRGEPVLELLTHPRQWNSPVIVNLRTEIARIVKGLYMKF